MATAMILAMQKKCILPPELIPLILSNLGKGDLLNCRPVCKSWDLECLKIFSTSEWRLRLHSNNFGDYVEFLQASTSPKLVLPLKLSVTFLLDVGRLMEGVKRLFGILGENCIESFTSSCGNSDLRGDKEKVKAYEKFMELLALVSTGLKELDLYEVQVDLHSQSVLSITTQLGSISFPNLKSFISKERPREGGVLVQGMFNHLMDNCPNLKELRMTYEGAIHHSNFPLATLEALGIDNFKPNLPFLQKFQLFNPPLKKFNSVDSEIETDSEWELFVSILTSISSTLESLEFTVDRRVSLTLPVLKRLKYLKYHTCFDSTVFETISQINFNSVTLPNLETLDIHNECHDDMEETIFPSSTLPDLPNLKKLTIHFHWVSVVWTWSTIPVLEKVEFPLEFLYYKQSTIFQTVTEVEIDCSSEVAMVLDEPGELSEKFLEENIQNIKILYPILSKISLEYRGSFSDEPSEVAKGEYYFVRLLKMFLEYMDETNLKEITILYGTSNYLGKAVKEMILPPPRIMLENLEGHPGLVDHVIKAWEDYTCGLEKIGISSEDKNATTVLQNLDDRDSSNLKVFTGVEKITMLPGWKLRTSSQMQMESNLDFSLIARHFPNIRDLVIPSVWFDKNKRLEQIQNIKQFFPTGINIDTVLATHFPFD